MKPHIMLQCSLKFCSMGPVFSVFLNVSCKFLIFILRVVSLQYQIPENSRLVTLKHFILYTGQRYYNASLDAYKKLSYNANDASVDFYTPVFSIKTLSSEYKILHTFDHLANDYILFLTGLSTVIQEKKINGANVLFIIIFFYSCNFLRKAHEWK